MTDGESGALLAARLLRLNPLRRVATVALRRVGRGQSFAGQYAGGGGQLAPVTDRWNPLQLPRQLGRLTTVRPTAVGAELDLVVGDDDAWQALAAGTAKITALVAFEGSSGGDPVGGRPVRVEIG